MKIWARPNALMRATAEVVQAHPYQDKQIFMPLSFEAIKILVLKIVAKADDELPAFAAVLSNRELYALCDYLPLNTYGVKQEKIAIVLGARMKESLYLYLLSIWMDAPECLQILLLLGEGASHAEWSRKSSIKVQYLEAWSQALQPLRAVAATCKERGIGIKFFDKIQSLGIKPETNLSRVCYENLMVYALLEEFEQEGDEQLSDFLQVCSIAVQKRILLRFLTCAQKNYVVLSKFPKCYDIAFSIWGTPKESSFAKTEQSAYRAYSWWFNYRQIDEVFDGDTRRKDYWKQYLHLCKCEKIGRRELVVMTYKDYVILEFQVMGPAYIFEKEYFDVAAASHVRYWRGTQKLRSWLLHEAKRCSREEHRGSWESRLNRELRRLRII